MLNKDLCKRCYALDGHSWDKVEDNNWDVYGDVVCLRAEASGATNAVWIPITAEYMPPKLCPFVVEHTVSC